MDLSIVVPSLSAFAAGVLLPSALLGALLAFIVGESLAIVVGLWLASAALLRRVGGGRAELD